jgi:3-hydroxyisobutyrate dehydrogenase-like beta-hydroxyacid dehydrogenase
MNTTTAVGFIGVGAMGMAMAANLHGKGFDVGVRDIRAEAEQEARGLGMRVCASPAAVASQADLVIVIVVDAQQIDDVLFGADGVVNSEAGGKTVMLCSTIAPQDTARIAARLAQHGISAIDAPISGGPARARAGTMSMMLAAPDEVLARHETVLAALSDKRFRISATIGDGARTKLVNNLLAGVNLVAGAEALALGMRIGLEPQKLFEVICASSGASWIFQDRMARVLQDDFAPRAFAHILNKDVTLATSMADSQGFDTPLGDAALAVFRETLARGWAQLDDAAVIKTYLGNAAPEGGS